MNLECEQDDNCWVIVDYDNNRKVFARANNVEGAWFFAARKMERTINKIKELTEDGAL